jgi:hypothetical protein
MRRAETYSEIFIVLTLGDIEMSCYRVSRFTPTLSNKPNASKSLMNIFPARIGPTVCELLGPTIWRGEGSYLPCEVEFCASPTSNTEKIEGGDDGMFWPFWPSVRA